MWQICKNNKSPQKVKPHRYFTIPKSKQRRTSVIKIILILEYSRLIMIKTVKKRNDDSHDEDGCSNQRGGIETSVTVCVFPLSLMHLPSTVITASTHAEAHSYDGDKDHKHDAEGCTYEKSRLVLDPLREESIHPVINLLSALFTFYRDMQWKLCWEEFTCSNKTTFSGWSTKPDVEVCKNHTSMNKKKTCKPGQCDNRGIKKRRIFISKWIKSCMMWHSHFVVLAAKWYFNFIKIIQTYKTNKL